MHGAKLRRRERACIVTNRVDTNEAKRLRRDVEDSAAVALRGYSHAAQGLGSRRSIVGESFVECGARLERRRQPRVERLPRKPGPSLAH